MRQDNTIIWLPATMLARLGVSPLSKLTADQWNARDLTELVHARDEANSKGLHCDNEWHRAYRKARKEAA